MNLRTPLASHELDYPFTSRRGGVRPAIPLRDLVVRHDPASGLLSLHTMAGVEVIPAHTGMMSEYLLPAGLQLLVRAFGTAPTLFQPARLLTPRPPAGEVCHAPRIEVGRVVLRRATWSVPPELVPRRAAGERDARFLLRLHDWLAGHGIPPRCFVLVTEPVPPGQAWPAAAFTKARKPLYLDLTSPPLVAVFERMTTRPAQRVTFREALPPLPDGDGARVAELVIEITAGAP